MEAQLAPDEQLTEEAALLPGAERLGPQGHGPALEDEAEADGAPLVREARREPAHPQGRAR
ncbi:MAG: hypothetical protein M9894_35365 [Planctomycetes bacterium]|nr:hypothetical protein [Planctomycetota bacterium]